MILRPGQQVGARSGQAEVTSVRKTALAMRVNYMGGELSHGKGLRRLQRKTTSLKGVRMLNNGFRFCTC